MGAAGVAGLDSVALDGSPLVPSDASNQWDVMNGTGNGKNGPSRRDLSTVP